MPRRTRRPQPKAESSVTMGATHYRRDGSPKVGYMSRGEALEAAKDSYQEEGLELVVYQCGECHGWHLASS